LLGDDALATLSWAEAARRPQASQATLREALRYLVHGGNLPTLRAVARAYLTRFGDPEPELAALLELRLAELERLVDARSRLELPTPASERGAP
jgi:hypothetical protein